MLLPLNRYLQHDGSFFSGLFYDPFPDRIHILHAETNLPLCCRIYAGAADTVRYHFLSGSVCANVPGRANRQYPAHQPIPRNFPDPCCQNGCKSVDIASVWKPEIILLDIFTPCGMILLNCRAPVPGII